MRAQRAGAVAMKKARAMMPAVDLQPLGCPVVPLFLFVFFFLGGGGGVWGGGFGSLSAKKGTRFNPGLGGVLVPL